MESEPIKSQEEADAIFNYLVNTAMLTVKIDKIQAEKRVRALFDSGVLIGRNPEEIETIMIVDKFMRTPID